MVTGELERNKRADAPLRERSRCITLVRTKVSFRMPRLEHLPQVLPLSSPSRRRGRGMSRETSLLSPGCSGSDLDFIEPYPGLSADQSGTP